MKMCSAKAGSDAAKQLAGIALLAVLGLLGNFLSLELISGLNLVFGSIAVLIAVYYYGIIAAVFVAAVISIPTYFLWNHYFGIATFLLEALVTGLLHHKAKKNLVISNMLFWLFIGMPMVWVNCSLSKMGTIETILLVLKQPINGLFNVVTASLIIHILVYRSKSRTISLRRFMLNFLTFSVIAVSLACIKIGTTEELRDMEAGIHVDVQNCSDAVSGMISRWYANHLVPLQVIARTLSDANMEISNDFDRELEVIRESFPDFQLLYIADAQGKAISITLTGEPEGSMEDLDFSDRAYYKQIRKTLEPVVSDVLLGRVGSKEPLVAICVPVIRDGDFIGYVAGAVNLDHISDLLAEHADGSNIQITLLDGEGKVIASTIPDLRRSGMYTRYRQGNVIYKGNGLYYRDTSGKGGKRLSDWRSSSYFHLGTPREIGGWTFVCEGSLFPYVYNLFTIYIYIFIFMLLVLQILFGFFQIIFKLVFTPFENLVQVISDLAHKIENQEKVEWPSSNISELRSIIASFRLVTMKLNETFQRIKKQKDELEHLAMYDQLTSLPNIRMLQKNIKERTAGPDSSQSFTIFSLELNRLKFINETLGYKSGDKLIKMAAKRLKEVFGNEYAIYRSSGDSFVLLPGPGQVQDRAAADAGNIIRVLSQPFNIDGLDVSTSISIGISIYPRDGANAEVLIRNADIAKHVAKQAGDNKYSFFSTGMDEKLRKRNILESELIHALEGEELTLYYQPIISSATGRMLGAEALLRWRHPGMGMIPPLEFIPVAEETGLIVPLGKWVLKEACKEAGRWETEFGIRLTVFVNISTIQLKDGDFVQTVKDILDETRLSPEHLVLEITETALTGSLQQTAMVFEELRKLGVRLALDDFGTGYSSLNYLKMLPVDILKIDRSYINGMLDNAYDKRIVEIITSIGKALDITIIGEGVEQDKQAELLKAAGCHGLQGYFYHRPVPPDELTDFIMTAPDESA